MAVSVHFTYIITSLNSLTAADGEDTIVFLSLIDKETEATRS